MKIRRLKKIGLERMRYENSYGWTLTRVMRKASQRLAACLSKRNPLFDRLCRGA